MGTVKLLRVNHIDGPKYDDKTERNQAKRARRAWRKRGK